MEWLWYLLAAVAVPFVFWLFKPDHLRRRLGLEKSAPPAPDHAAGMDEKLLRLDPAIDEVLTPDLVPHTS